METKKGFKLVILPGSEEVAYFESPTGERWYTDNNKNVEALSSEERDSQRKEGYYWVRSGSGWEILLWDARNLQFHDNYESWGSISFNEIDENQITRK